ncbi:2-hydroxyacylsphingosine 1-beta-galactosyltransferase-like [Watersipora subatra]|uniref:2-hydroxyacylsphingosine 1-beta-galactosyltransferase-like n=1 Tax=Watersipora subatra TaxID=2589382 RepID=UPI00355BF0E9
MESLALHLSKQYHVTFMTDSDASVRNKEIYRLADVDFVYKSNRTSYIKMEVKDNFKSAFSIVKQVKLKTEEGMTSLFSQREFLDQLKSSDFSCMLYNSMDYGMPVLCKYLNLTCLQVITSGLGGPNNPLSLELMDTVPHTISSDTDLIGLRKRFKNFVFYMLDHYLRLSYFYPGAEAIAKSYGLFPSEEKQSFWQLAANTPAHSIIYTNDAIDCNTPLSDSYTRVGAAMLSNTTLDSSYQAVMDSADHGVVLVAFGKGAHKLSLQFFQHLITCFGALPFTFIMSVGSSSSVRELQTMSESIPSNVYLAQSVPQNSLLAHKNCRLFVTHAGIGSTTEAIYHAVPVITIPFYADQQKNAVKLTKILKMGVNMNPGSLDSISFKRVIQRVLNDSQFKEKAQEASRTMRNCGEGTADERVMSSVKIALGTSSFQTRPDSTKHWVHFIKVDILIILVIFVTCLLGVIIGALIVLKRIAFGLRKKSSRCMKASTFVVSYTFGLVSLLLYIQYFNH